MINRAAPSCDAADHKASPRSSLVSPAALERAARTFRALGDVPRLRLLALLSQGEACVTELSELLDDELSTVSQRLRVLRAENLVTRRRRGKHINYSLTDQHIVDLLFNALAHSSELPATSGPRSGPTRRKQS